MEKYDYVEAIKADISTFLEDNDVKLTEENFDELEDEMLCSDQVTGNASGSYTFSTWKAEENLCHNWDLVEEVAEEYGIKADMNKGAEYWDVVIRCYLLNSCMCKLMQEGEE